MTALSQISVIMTLIYETRSHVRAQSHFYFRNIFRIKTERSRIWDSLLLLIHGTAEMQCRVLRTAAACRNAKSAVCVRSLGYYVISDFWRLDFFTKYKKDSAGAGFWFMQSVHEVVQAVEMCLLLRHSVTLRCQLVKFCRIAISTQRWLAALRKALVYTKCSRRRTHLVLCSAITAWYSADCTAGAWLVWCVWCRLCITFLAGLSTGLRHRQRTVPTRRRWWPPACRSSMTRCTYASTTRGSTCPSCASFR